VGLEGVSPADHGLEPLLLQDPEGLAVGIAFFLLFGAEPLRRDLHTGKVVTDPEEGKRPATLALPYRVRRAERPP